ncbi:MAG: outer membrane lipoprotein-sorting protein [Deltaproteobacteria bacterium]|nr:outer membrane lipoprotein-sorting protein [Deltaproteobacteria bacterium]
MRTGVVAVLLLCTAGARAQDVTVEELMRAQDDALRGASSTGTMTMRVKTARWERSLTMQSWSEGTEKTLVRILAPAKEKGTATLKVEGNIWNYLPKVDRTIKVPGSMMGGSWMGSHFTNDDLVREARYSEDFTCAFVEKPDGKTRDHWVIDCTPRPNAPVVWGRVRLAIRAVDKLADRIDYLDEKGARVRTLVFSEFTTLGGRKLARMMRMVPADKPDEFTEVHQDDLAFDVKLPADTFTLQALKK